MRAAKRRAWAVAAAAIAAGLLASAPGAQAADTFVDAATGADVNPCTSAAAPCETIAAAIDKADSNDAIRVAPGIYAGPLTVGDGKSLRATGTAASTVIDSPTAPTIDVVGAVGTIEGFSIRGSGSTANTNPPLPVVRLQAPSTLEGNVFDAVDDGPDLPLDLLIGPGGRDTTITRNTFVDDGVAGAGDSTAIVSQSAAGVPLITDNLISGFFRAISVEGGSPFVEGNVITDTHNATSGNQGIGIGIFGGATNTAPTVSANLIRRPATRPAAALPTGIGVIQFVSGPTTPTTGATLRRNRIAGHSFGLQVASATAPVTLDSDAITGATVTGLQAGGSGAQTVTARNVTLAANAFDVSVSNTALTLDSSIVEDSINATSGSTCQITFSRGPTTAGTCGVFQTTADPLFVATPGGADKEVHLQSTSPMRGAGDPAVPPADALDFDGDARSLPFNGTSSPRRDIGADESIPTGFALPDTQIDSGPAPGGDSDDAPVLTFSSATTDATFQCSIDGASFADCASPFELAGLGGGDHTVAVRALDPSLVSGGGLPDDTPATRTFNVDAVPPETAIDEGPAAGSTTNGSPGFTLSSEPGAGFECSLDRAPFSPCEADHDLTGLSTGEHRLAVRSLDGVGNADPTAAVRSWSVDATAPETTITSGPEDGALTNRAQPSYEFASEPEARFECSVDDRAFAPCTSPGGPGRLDDGRHEFAIRAVDAVGNVDPSPAGRSLRVDTRAPETIIAKVKARKGRAKVRLSSDEAGATFACKFDKKPFKPCGPRFKSRRLKAGRHILRVVATDEAGNADVTAAKRKFRVRR